MSAPVIEWTDRPLVDAGSGLRTAPGRWFSTCHRPDGYLHLPRSFSRHSNGRRHWTSAHAWCGVAINSPEWFDEVPAGRRCCGTCLGRLDGISHDAIAFAPRDIRWLPKRWCPGPRQHLVWPLPRDGRRGICQICRTEVRSWGDSWVRHEHEGRGLACSRHGWRWLALRDEDIVCTAWQCDGTIHPFWVIAPEADQ